MITLYIITYVCVSWFLMTSCRYKALSCVLNGGLHRTFRRGRILILYGLDFIYIAYLGLELIYAVIPSVVVYPMP
jgi:hypothetical protein